MNERLADGEYHWTSRIRMTDKLKKRLKTEAANNDQSMAVYIGNVLREHITQGSSA